MRVVHGLWAMFLMLLAVLPVTMVQAADDDAVLPFEIHERELENGLKVIVVPTGFPNLVSIQIPVQTGSRNEIEPGKTGFAHFFEHMMFRGSETISPAAYQNYLKQMGARQNAYTTNDYTNYHTTFAKDDLELMIRLEADRFMNLSYDEAAFKTEARAVLGEYNKNSANPGSKLWEAMKKAAFEKHTYRHTTMGFIEDIEDMPNQFDYSKVFFDRWYRPEYTAVIIAGDVDVDDTFELVERYFGKWQQGSYESEIPSEPAPKGPIYTHVPWTVPTLSRLVLAFRGPGLDADSVDYAALNLFYRMSFGESSELYQKLVVKEQKLNALYGYGSRSRDPDLYPVVAMAKNTEDLVYIRDQLMQAFAKATTELVSQEKLDAVRSNYRYGLASGLDNTESIAAMLASYVHYERRTDTLNRLFRSMAKVTPEDIQRVARTYFTDKNLVLTSLSHDKVPTALSKIPELASFRKALNPQPFSGELVLQENELPGISLKLLFKTGSATDPKGQEGLARLSASMLSDAGSELMAYEDLTEMLYPMAASISSRVDKEMTTFTLRFHKDHSQKALDSMLANLLRPGFRDSDFTRVKSDQLNSLTNSLRTNNEEELGKERLQELIFAGTGYAHPVLGTVAGIEASSLSDVKRFVAQAYTQDRLLVGLSGDFDEEFVEALKLRLGSLPKTSTLPATKKVKPRKLDGMQVNIIEKDTRATAISLGHPLAINRSHEDFPALWLARAWLGEHRSSMSHLYQRIRAIRGMNYGDYAYIEAFPGGMYQFFPPSNVARQSQIFEIWIRPVVPDHAHMALRIALFELDKLVKNGLTEAQFLQTRDYLMKNVFVMTATQNQQLGYALDSKWYGIGEFTSYMRDRLAKLTVKDVNKAIRKHLSAEDLQVVMITKDAAGLKKKLASNELSEMSYNSKKPQDLLEEDRIIGRLRLNLSDKRINITPVNEVFSGSTRSVSH